MDDKKNNVSNIADILYAFYNRLIENGFSAEDAIELTKELIATSFGNATKESEK